MANKREQTGERTPTGFGLWLRSQRESKSLSMAALAERCGFRTYMTIWRLECGDREPLLRTAQRLARALGTSLDAFPWLEEPTPTPTARPKRSSRQATR